MPIPKVIGLDMRTWDHKTLRALRWAALAYVSSHCEQKPLEVDLPTGKIVGKSMAILEAHFQAFAEICKCAGYNIDCMLVARWDGQGIQLAWVPNAITFELDAE
jgi:hypothetical protein